MRVSPTAQPIARASALPALHKLEGHHTLPRRGTMAPRTSGCSCLACVTCGLLAVRLLKASMPCSARSPSAFRTAAFPQPEYLAATAEFAHASENELMKVAGSAMPSRCPSLCFVPLQVQPRTEEGDFCAWALIACYGVALEGGEHLALVLGAPQCPRKVPPSQATR